MNKMNQLLYSAWEHREQIASTIVTDSTMFWCKHGPMICSLFDIRYMIFILSQSLGIKKNIVLQPCCHLTLQLIFISYQVGLCEDKINQKLDQF